MLGDMESKTKIAILSVLVFLGMQEAYGKNIVAKDSTEQKLTLMDVVSLAIEQSPAVKNAENVNVNYYWRWRNFKTKFRPQLVLSGNLPNYTQSNVGVTQPDGSLQFVNVTNLSTSARIALNQSIPLTGTSIYASTSAIRFQD